MDRPGRRGRQRFLSGGCAGHPFNLRGLYSRCESAERAAKISVLDTLRRTLKESSPIYGRKKKKNCLYSFRSSRRVDLAFWGRVHGVFLFVRAVCCLPPSLIVCPTYWLVGSRFRKVLTCELFIVNASHDVPTEHACVAFFFFFRTRCPFLGSSGPLEQVKAQAHFQLSTVHCACT